MYRLVRYADDFVVLVSGTQAQAEALKAESAAVLFTVGLRLSQEKTSVCNISEGFVFLGFRIQRRKKRGTNKVYVYSWPSKKALASIMAKVKAITRQGNRSAALARVAPAQLGAARVGGLLPARLLKADLQLPEPLHVAAGRWMVAPKAPPCQLEGDQTALPDAPGRRAGASRRWDRALQPRIGAGHPVPLPRHEDPEPVDPAEHDDKDQRLTSGLVESRVRWKAHARCARDMTSSSGVRVPCGG